MVMVMVVRVVVDNDLRILSYTCNATKSNADGVIVASFDVSSNYDDSISGSSDSCCCCSDDRSDGDDSDGDSDSDSVMNLFLV